MVVQMMYVANSAVDNGAKVNYLCNLNQMHKQLGDWFDAIGYNDGTPDNENGFTWVIKYAVDITISMKWFGGIRIAIAGNLKIYEVDVN